MKGNITNSISGIGAKGHGAERSVNAELLPRRYSLRFSGFR
jgi:hypothetical protein